MEGDQFQASVGEPEVTPGKEYCFRVSAENAAGVGKASFPTALTKLQDPLGKKLRTRSVIPQSRNPFKCKKYKIKQFFLPETPSHPRNLRYDHVTKSSIELTWSAPKCDGGTPVTDYVVELSDKADESGLWVEAGKMEADDKLAFVVTCVEEGHEYAYRVKAVNKVGEGKPSDATPYVLAKDETSKYVVDVIVTLLLNRINVLTNVLKVKILQIYSTY